MDDKEMVPLKDVISELLSGKNGSNEEATPPEVPAEAAPAPAPASTPSPEPQKNAEHYHAAPEGDEDEKEREEVAKKDCCVLL